MRSWRAKTKPNNERTFFAYTLVYANSPRSDAQRRVSARVSVYVSVCVYVCREEFDQNALAMCSCWQLNTYIQRICLSVVLHGDASCCFLAPLAASCHLRILIAAAAVRADIYIGKQVFYPIASMLVSIGVLCAWECVWSQMAHTLKHDWPCVLCRGGISATLYSSVEQWKSKLWGRTYTQRSERSLMKQEEFFWHFGKGKVI